MIVQVMDAIADRLADLAVDGLQVTPRMDFNPTPPSLDIYPSDPFAEKLQFGEVAGTVWLLIRARVSTSDHEAGQETLLSLMEPAGATSVAAAIADDQTLGGLVDSLDVEGPSGYIRYEDSGSQGALLGCQWRVMVLVKPEPFT